MKAATFFKQHIVKFCIAFGLLFCLPSLVWSAPVLPNPADIPRPLPITPSIPRPAEIQQQETAPQAPATQSSTLRVVVNQFVFSGNQTFNDAQLSALLTDFVGKEATLTTLQLASKRVTDFYRKHGYLLAVAYLPAQDIDQNTVEIAVLEGQLGALNLNAPAALSQSFLAKMAQYKLEPDDAITERNLVAM